MKQTVRTVVGSLVHAARRRRARLVVRRLLTHDDTRVRAVGRAVSRVVTGATDDTSEFGDIERRRRSLLDSDESIEVIDYGAGSAASSRTRDEMEAGVRSTARVADVCRWSKSPFWAALLFEIVRELRPASGVELGACVGISAAYQGTAMKLNGGGRLVSLEGSPEIARIAADTLEQLQIPNVSIVIGPFHTTLADVLEAARPVDYFFNDGHHDHAAVIRNFEVAYPHMADDAVMVFDDISWSPGMRAAWTQIGDDPRISASIDLGTIGIVLLGRADTDRSTFNIPL